MKKNEEIRCAKEIQTNLHFNLIKLSLMQKSIGILHLNVYPFIRLLVRFRLQIFHRLLLLISQGVAPILPV